jgi:probable phosphoglycerate mutase
MDMGDWENLGEEQILLRDRMRFQSWMTDPDFRAPGGESMREVYGRSFPDLVNIVHHADEGETLVLVVQEGVLRALCCGVLDLHLESAHRFRIDNAAFAVFERVYPRGPYQLVHWNNKEHLVIMEPDFEPLETVF